MVRSIVFVYDGMIEGSWGVPAENPDIFVQGFIAGLEAAMPSFLEENLSVLQDGDTLRLEYTDE